MSQTTDLTVSNGMPALAEMDAMERLANNLAGSGLFKDATQARAAFAKILFGRDMGLSASAAMTGLHIVEGKPELSANLQAQLVNTYRGQDGERYRYRVREHSNEACAVEFLTREPGGDWEPLGTARYEMADAERAGLTGRGPWKKHPRNMLWARAMSDGVNFYCPEVARGLRAYHEGEISDGPQPTATMPTVPGDILTGGEAAASSTLAAPEPEVIDAEVVETVGDEVAATILQGCEILAERGVKTGTMLTAHGAQRGQDLASTVATLPADQGDAVLRWLDERVQALSEDPPEPAMSPGEAVAEGM